jgi:RHS repeat-associated protein
VNGNWAFTYDYLNRVSTANKNSGQQAFSYGYDQLGNRTSQSVTAGSGGTLSLSYLGNNNRMDGFTYDAAGNLQGDVLHNYAYDAENHLIAVDGGNTASYVYDAEGRRVQKTTTAQVEYLYDLNGNIVTELSSTGAWNRGEIFANGRHLATYNNGTTYFDHADWLGTERARSDMTGANCQTITNVTFGDGQSLSGTGSNCVDASPLHFTGQQWDSESGLHYFRARHYSTQFGRFMSPDPTGIFLGNLNDPQSLNLYAYVRNNSPSMTDPSGLCDTSL